MGGSPKKVRSIECVISRGHCSSHYLPSDRAAHWPGMLANGEENSARRCKCPIQVPHEYLVSRIQASDLENKVPPSQNDRQSWFPVRKTMRCVKKLWFLRGKNEMSHRAKYYFQMVLCSSFEWQLLRIQLCVWHAGIQNGSSVGGQEWIEMFDLNTHLRIFEYLSFFIT